MKPLHCPFQVGTSTVAPTADTQNFIRFHLKAEKGRLFGRFQRRQHFFAVQWMETVCDDEIIGAVVIFLLPGVTASQGFNTGAVADNTKRRGLLQDNRSAAAVKELVAVGIEGVTGIMGSAVPDPVDDQKGRIGQNSPFPPIIHYQGEQYPLSRILGIGIIPIINHSVPQQLRQLLVIGDLQGDIRRRQSDGGKANVLRVQSFKRSFFPAPPSPNSTRVPNNITATRADKKIFFLLIKTPPFLDAFVLFLSSITDEKSAQRLHLSKFSGRWRKNFSL